MYQKRISLLLILIRPTLSNDHKRIDNILFLHIQENILLNESDQTII
jgi:hypothetical protein